MALHEDPGEEPFCSPTDAPVATERYRRHKGPHGNANRRQREGITTGREKGMGRARRLLPLRFHPKKPADATAFFANRHGPNRRPYAHNRKARTERTLQPRTGSSLRTEHGPTDPVLGANPSSEGTDPFCRLPLPTLMPSTRGCTPWRPAADGGYGPARELRNNRTRIFQGRRKRTGRRPSRGALQVPFPYLRTSRFHGHGPLRRRENSSRGSRRRLRARLRHRGFARESDGRHRRRQP